MKVTTFICFMALTIIPANSFSQNHRDTLSRWPSFSFRVTGAGNMYFGLKKTNFHNNRILRTPPAIGPELIVTTGIRMRENATIHIGASLSMIPIYTRHKIHGGLIAYPDFELSVNDYFLALSVIGIPISYEHSFKVKRKHYVTAEAGISINCNTTNSYGYSLFATVGEEPPYFHMELYDNNGLKWYPSGFFRIGYMKTFKKWGAFGAAVRFSYSAATLGRGFYKFNGFEGDDFFNGDLSVPVNALCFDFTYHFRHTRKR